MHPFKPIGQMNALGCVGATPFCWHPAPPFRRRAVIVAMGRQSLGIWKTWVPKNPTPKLPSNAVQFLELPASTIFPSAPVFGTLFVIGKEETMYLVVLEGGLLNSPTE